MVQSSMINGLYKKYGTDLATPGTAGEYTTYGRLHEVEVKIDLTALTQAELIQDDNTIIPKGVIIQEVEIDVKTAAATGVAIDLGTTSMTDRSTEVDFNGLLAALVTASMTPAGTKLIVSTGSTSAGAQLGAVTTVPSYISCSATTGTFYTTGYIIVTIRYWKP